MSLLDLFYSMVMLTEELNLSLHISNAMQKNAVKEKHETEHP